MSRVITLGFSEGAQLVFHTKDGIVSSRSLMIGASMIASGDIEVNGKHSMVNGLWTIEIQECDGAKPNPVQDVIFQKADDGTPTFVVVLDFERDAFEQLKSELRPMVSKKCSVQFEVDGVFLDAETGKWRWLTSRAPSLKASNFSWYLSY